MNFGCFLYEVTETFVQFFRKYHDVFAKTSLRYKNMSFTCFQLFLLLFLELRLNL